MRLCCDVSHMSLRIPFRHEVDVSIRGLVKQLLPYGIESAYIRRRYGQVSYFDRIAESERMGVVRRILRMVLPYCFVSLSDRRRYGVTSVEMQRVAFRRIAEAVRIRSASGRPVRVLFMISDASMFAARPLFHAMEKDCLFDPKVVVVPDFRHKEDDVIRRMELCEKTVGKFATADRLVRVRPNADGDWPDVLEGVDIVCYPTPHDSSFHRYCIRASAGRDVLPVHVNYGFYRSVYDRSIMADENYARFWKVFFECDATMSEYAEFSQLKGANAVMSGYVKMDRLAVANPMPHARRRVLVALHHSIEGGKNDKLLLANVSRMSDFFKSLPDRWPDIDFVFRPHPFLIETLSRRGAWGKRRTERYFSDLMAKPNVIWSDGGDYFREFAESDGCIQDCGSYLVEYLYTGKPCCYMLKSSGDMDAKFAPLGKRCLEQCYIAYDSEAIDAFIRDVVVGGKDPKADQRARFARTIMVNYPHASEVALENIRKSIGLQCVRA